MWLGTCLQKPCGGIIEVDLDEYKAHIAKCKFEDRMSGSSQMVNGTQKAFLGEIGTHL